MEKTILLLFIILISFIVLTTFVWTANSKTNKNKLYDNLPKAKTSWIDKMSNNKDVKVFLDELTKGTGIKDDCFELLIKEETKTLIASLGLLVFSSIVGYFYIGLIIAVVLVCYPVLRRISDKKEYKKKYISGFYKFLDYIILYTSGGVPMAKAIIEVEKLIKEDEVIKPRLKAVVSKNSISGLSGNTYIDALKELNEGLDYPEINLFIHTAERSISRGDEISDVLLGQLDDIFKKVEIEKRGVIAKLETKFAIYQVTLNMAPTLVLFAGPILISAIMSLNIF